MKLNNKKDYNQKIQSIKLSKILIILVFILSGCITKEVTCIEVCPPGEKCTKVCRDDWGWE